MHGFAVLCFSAAVDQLLMLDADLVADGWVLEAVRGYLALALNHQIVHTVRDVHGVGAELRFLAVGIYAARVFILRALFDQLPIGVHTLRETPVNGVRDSARFLVFVLDLVGGLRRIYPEVNY